jgi:amino acid adenylation domain-containing protein
MTLQGCDVLSAVEETAATRPERVSLRFHAADGRAADAVTAAELVTRVHRHAAGLQALGLVAGARMLVGCSEPQVAVLGFLAVAAAGGIPVMVPARGRFGRRLEAIVADCAPFGILLDDRLADLRRGPNGVPVFALGDLDGAWCGRAATQASDPAFIQYTSGTTGDPKGVVVTHAQLAANSRMIAAAFGHSGETRFAGWVPLYHDMGLVGATLHPLLIGAEAALMPTEAFLRRPESWLRMISEARATTSGAPDFAYRACLSIPPARLADIDLSSWTVAYTGAEAVRADTLSEFGRRMAPLGFRMESWLPCYGMAETTLLASGARTGRAPKLRKPHDAPEAMGSPAVCLGPPVPRSSIRIVDPATGRECAEGAIGEIWIAGPHVASRYWNRTEPLCSALPDGRKDVACLASGDLGFMVDGALYFTGRLKEMIVLSGRNIFPDDLEIAVAGTHGLEGREPRLVAMSVTTLSRRLGRKLAESGADTCLVLVLERHLPGDAELARRLAARLADTSDCDLAAILFVPRGTVEFTTSGKPRRQRLAERLDSGDALIETAWLSPVFSDAAGRAAREAVSALRAGATTRTVADAVAAAAGIILGLDAPVDPGRPLVEAGCTSLAALRLANLLQAVDADRSSPQALHPGLSPAEIAFILKTRDERAGTEAGEPLGSQEILERRREIGDAPYVLAFAILGPAERMAQVARAAAQLRLLPERGAPPPASDLGTLPDEATLRQAFADATRAPFDPSGGQPVRLARARLATGEDALLVMAHHAFADFWALARIASALVAGMGAGIPHMLQAGAASGLRASLAPGGPHAPAADPLPTDRTGPTGGEPLRAGVTIPARTIADLTARTGQTPFVVVAACLATVFGRWSGGWNRQVVVPVRRPGEPVGYGVVVRPLAWSLDAGLGFGGACARLGSTVRDLLENASFRPDAGADIAHVHIPAGSGIEERLARLVLRDGRSRFQAGDLRLWSDELGPHRLELPVECVSCESDGAVEIALRFDGGLFDAGTPEALAAAVRRVAEGAAADIDRPLAELFDAGAAPAILGDAGDRVALDGTLPAAILAQSTRDPEAAAMVSGDQTLSYGALATLSARAARHLLLHLAPGETVAVLCDFSIPAFSAMVGALRAGMRIVAISPDLPASRREAIAREASVALAIAEDAGVSLATRPTIGLHMLLGNDDPGGGLPNVAPEDEAYAVFTSGTTGRPKGIVHRHGTFLAFLRWQAGALGMRPGARVAQIAASGFDVAFCELFGALVTGATLVLPDRRADLVPDRLLPWVDRQRVTTLQITPSLLAAALSAGGAIPPCLEIIATVGEPLAPALAGRLLDRPDLRVVNVYGPSETVAAAWHDVNPADAGRRIVPVGQPIAGREIEIRSPDGRLLPVGVEGIVHVRTLAMPAGYLGDADQAGFVEPPDAAAGRAGLFRSGDIGLVGHDGLLRIRGRADRQVKVNGIRVEPADVEGALVSLPGVLAAAVVVERLAEGGERLAAAIQTGADVDLSELRRMALALLPLGLVPQRLVRVETIARTPNGKVDRDGIAKLLATADGRTVASAPLSTVEAALAEDWVAILGMDRDPAPDSDFFADGGHSIAAMRLLNRAGERFGCKLSLAAFMADPRLSSLAAAVAAAGDAQTAEVRAAEC